MQIRENISLRPYNTFGIEATAQYFAAFKTNEELEELLQDPKFPSRGPAFILGGGSNILLTKDIGGLVVKNELKGIEVVKEDEACVYVNRGRERTGTAWFCIA